MTPQIFRVFFERGPYFTCRQVNILRGCLEQHEMNSGDTVATTELRRAWPLGRMYVVLTIRSERVINNPLELFHKHCSAVYSVKQMKEG